MIVFCLFFMCQKWVSIFVHNSFVSKSVRDRPNEQPEQKKKVSERLERPSVRCFFHSQMFSLRERESKVPLLVLECECLWASLSQSHLIYVCTLSDLCCLWFSLWFTNQWMNSSLISQCFCWIRFHLFHRLFCSRVRLKLLIVWFIKRFETNKPLKEQWRFGRLSVLTHKHISTSTREWRRRHVWVISFDCSNSPGFWLSNMIFEGWRKIFLVLQLQ